MRWLDGKKVGRNDSCPCGSGEKLKRCCEPLVREPATGQVPNVGAYVSSADLWPTRAVELSRVRARLAEFDPVDLAQVLAKISFRLQGHFHSVDRDAENEILQLFLSPTWYRKVRLWLDSGMRAVCFHRPLLPAALQLLMTAARESEGGWLAADHKHTVGEFLLDLNALLGKEYKDTLAASTTTQNRTLIAELFRLGFYFHTDHFGSAIARHWSILTEGLLAVGEEFPREAVDFQTMFEEAFSFPYHRMLALVMAIVSHYFDLAQRPLTDPRQFLVSAMSFEEETRARIGDSAERIFSYLGLGWREHVEQMKQRAGGEPGSRFQFFSIYDHPLVTPNGREYFPLDLQFLEAAATDGPYWALVRHLAPDAGPDLLVPGTDGEA